MTQNAPSELRSLWAEWKAKNPYPPETEQEQLVLLFGVSELSGEMLGFHFVSFDDFAPEDLSFRTRKGPFLFAKPRCSCPQIEDMSEVPQAILDMMHEQRANQAGNVYNGNGQVTIGGELELYYLSAAGCSIRTAHRFDDWETTAAALWGGFRAGIPQASST